MAAAHSPTCNGDCHRPEPQVTGQDDVDEAAQRAADLGRGTCGGVPAAAATAANLVSLRCAFWGTGTTRTLLPSLARMLLYCGSTGHPSPRRGHPPARHLRHPGPICLVPDAIGVAADLVGDAAG